MKYEEAHIEALLSRFMKAETTLAEEQQLADFFASTPSVPRRWSAFAILFAGIEAGVLEKIDSEQPSPNELHQPSAARSLRHVGKSRRSLLWLRVAGVAAMLCLCSVVGRMVWLKEDPVTVEKSAIATSEKQSLQPANKQSGPSCAALMTTASAVLQPHTPSAVPNRFLSSRNDADKSRRLAHSPKMAAKNDGEKSFIAAEQESTSRGEHEESCTPPHVVRNEQQPAPLPDIDQSDLSEYIVAAAFTYPEHSRLDERAIKGRNRVRAEVMEQYAHLGF